MEVKCWNYQNSPAFDIANFDGFYREIYTNPNKLYAEYLIFAYIPNKHGFEVENIYLKNLWEITAPTRQYPIGLQVKQGRPYAIRPFPFHKTPEKSFNGISEFINAIYTTRKMFMQCGVIEPEEWLATVNRHLQMH